MHHNQIFEIQDYYNPQMQRELFELIEKVYFHDFGQTPPSYEVEGAASFIDTSEFELKKLSLNCEAIETSTTDTNSEGVEMRLNKDEIEKRVKHLRVQLDVVGRKCSDIILQNSQAYSVELKRVSDFKGLLEDSYQICAIARRALAMSEFMFVVPSLKLVKKQLKKSHLVQLYTAVTEIKSFHNSTVHISELIKNREFSKAISLCMKNEKSMAKYEHLKCIKGLKKTVRDYYETIEENLESSLSKVCRNYDETLLDEIFTAYALLDKCEDFVDKLSLSTLNSVNLVAAETLIGVIVNAFVLSENLTSNTKENLVKVNAYIDELKKKEFNHLFNLISLNDYNSSLVNMCLNLWQIMKNYYRILVFTYNTCLAKSQTSPAINMEKLEPKFSSGLNKIWQDVQLKLSTYFRSMCFDHFKFDQFLDILTILNRFIELGHEFCNKNSNSRLLVDAAKDQTLAYFKAYHIMHLEELKMFLENETWQWCPVRSDFSIYKLQEYKFLKENNTNSRKNSKSTSRKQQTNGTGNGHKSKDLNLLNPFDDNNSISSEQQFDGTDNTATRRSSSSHHQKSSSSSSLMSNGSTLSDASLSRAKNSGAFEVNPAFMSLLKEENPIEKSRGRHDGEEGTDEASGSDDDSEQIDENKNVLVRMKQEQMLNGHGGHNDDGDVTNTNLSLSTSSSMNLSVGGLSNSNVPILTNTTLNVIRLFGKYIHMLSIFKIISQQVITYLMQLFQFYFYFIYLDFTQQEPDKEKESSNSTTNNSLQIIIKNIKNELFANSKFNITEPKISSIKAVYNREDYLECINQRIVAAESLIFLAHEIECLLPLITSYVPDASTIQSSLSTYQHMLGEISKIREPIYLFAANLAFDWTAMFESVSRVNWDLHDILSQHNPYVDMLLRQMQTMIVDIESLGSGEEAMRRLPMSRALVGAFVREALKLVMRRLVDAYASVKKCSNEGRALMQLDFQQLVVKLEKLCDVRPIPEKDYVEAYIKAFYLPDSSIEKWISDHSEYQPKHIVSLLNVMAQVTKKTRTSIITSFGNNINN